VISETAKVKNTFFMFFNFLSELSRIREVRFCVLLLDH
jgi:hypothetical protein